MEDRMRTQAKYDALTDALKHLHKAFDAVNYVETEIAHDIAAVVSKVIELRGVYLRSDAEIAQLTRRRGKKE